MARGLDKNSAAWPVWLASAQHLLTRASQRASTVEQRCCHGMLAYLCSGASCSGHSCAVTVWRGAQVSVGQGCCAHAVHGGWQVSEGIRLLSMAATVYRSDMVAQRRIDVECMRLHWSPSGCSVATRADAHTGAPRREHVSGMAALALVSVLRGQQSRSVLGRSNPRHHQSGNIVQHVCF